MPNIQIRGIDVSYCQSCVDFGAVKGGGYGFVMLKLGNVADNGLKIDAMFDRHYKNAKAAGLNVGAYVFSYITNPANAEFAAKKVAQFITGGKYLFEYPVALDIESYDTPTQKNYCGTKDGNTKIAVSFLNVLQENKFYAMLYTGLSFIRGYFDDTRLSAYDKWIAQYAPKSVCDYNKPLGMWQCTVAGSPTLNYQKWTVPGVPCECDGNIAYKDYAEIIKRNRLNGWN
jgi:GH25 family lysozyme M1 (1,4-beta-N-acetylmuramidase)